MPAIPNTMDFPQTIIITIIAELDTFSLLQVDYYLCCGWGRGRGITAVVLSLHHRLLLLLLSQEEEKKGQLVLKSDTNS